MRITPLDVRKQEFKRVVRGLDPEEVYAFMATIADEYESVLTDNKQLREKVLDLDDKVTEYRNMEKTLRDTLLTAERVMAEARENARKESELVLKDARLKADQHTASIAARVEALRTELRELRAHRDAFLVRLRTLAESQMQLVDNYRRDFESDDQRVLDGAREDTDGSGPRTARTPSRPAPSSATRSPSAIPRTSAGAPGRGSPSDDQWREYAVGARERAAAGEVADLSTADVPPAAPTPPVVTGVDAVTPQSEAAVAGHPVLDAAPRHDLGHLADMVAAVQRQASDTEPARSEDGPWPDADDGFPTAQSGGQPLESVAPYPGPVRRLDAAAGPYPPSSALVAGEPGDPGSGETDAEPAPLESHASAASAGDAEGHGASASGWSLSRFTKGLGRF
jgi:cell division initiation protein